MRTLSFIFFFLFALTCFSEIKCQSWELSYGDEYFNRANSVLQTIDSGYIISGYSNTANNSEDIYLLKVSEDGDFEWEETYGNNNSDVGTSILQLQNGNYIITGSLNNNLFLTELNNDGIEIWTKEYLQEYNSTGYSVETTNDGGYIILGTVLLDSQEIVMIKTDNLGNIEWQQTYGDVGTDVGFYLSNTTDGGYIVTGFTNSYNGYNQICLIKIHENGDLDWMETYGSNICKAYSVKQTNDNGYIITGYTYSETNGKDLYVIKVNTSGSIEWTRTIGYTSDDIGNDIELTLDGGYIITGYFGSSNSSDRDLWLIKLNESGYTEWESFFGGTQYDVGKAVHQTNDNGFIISGYTFSYGNDSQVYLIKTDSEGTLSSEFTIPTPSPRKLDKVVDVLGREVNQSTNQFLFYIYDDGSVEKKFIVE